MKKVYLIIPLLFIIPFVVQAKIGVGVGNGKIILNEPLKAGTINQITPISVLNTGDEASWYEMDITFHVDYEGSWPKKEWFHFSPEKFYLEAGDVQLVEVRLDIPIKAIPGEYFNFIEARPTIESDSAGGAKINIAAATKFQFSIAPNNIFQGIYYRFLSLYNGNKPWSHVVVSVIVVAILFTIFRRNFNLQLNIGRKK